jgi:hypothetical protein
MRETKEAGVGRQQTAGCRRIVTVAIAISSLVLLSRIFPAAAAAPAPAPQSPLTETFFPALLPLLQVRVHLSISQPASQPTIARRSPPQPIQSDCLGQEAIAGTSQQNLKSFPGRCGRYTLHSLPLSVHPRLFCLHAHSHSHTSALCPLPSVLTGLAFFFSFLLSP